MHVNDVWVKMYSEFQWFYGPIFTLKHAFSWNSSMSTTQTALQQSATPNQNWGMLVFNARVNPNTFSRSSLSSLFETNIIKSGGSPRNLSRDPSHTNPLNTPPCQATPVTLPGQQVRTCIGPVSMT